MINYSEIARKCIGPGGAPYHRHHINEVMHGRRNLSPLLEKQLISLGVWDGRRHCAKA